MERVTQHDVAKAAGVSQRTVATVVGRSTSNSRVSEKVRKCVLRIANEMGYRPHRGAQLMRGGRSGLIGHLKSPTYHEDQVAAGIRFGEVMAEQGYGVLALDMQRGWKYLEQTLQIFNDSQIEGLLLDKLPPEIESSQALNGLLAQKVPVVTLEEKPQTPCSTIYTLVPDHERGMSLLVEHLLGLGFRRIAMVVDSLNPFLAVRQRITAYLTAMRKAGLEPDLVEITAPDLEVSVGLNMSMGWRGMEELLRRKRLPEAVCFKNDQYAMGALALCRERGIVVPDDVAVAGYNNTTMSQFHRPAITSVEHFTGEVAEAAAELLARLIRGEVQRREPRCRRFPSRLHIRASTDKKKRHEAVDGSSP